MSGAGSPQPRLIEESFNALLIRSLVMARRSCSEALTVSKDSVT